MNPNKPICKPCAGSAKRKGYLMHHLPPYLLNKHNKVRCYLCGETRYHYMYLNLEFERHPRKVRTVR